jgi:hypothetical protein
MMNYFANDPFSFSLPRGWNPCGWRSSIEPDDAAGYDAHFEEAAGNNIDIDTSSSLGGGGGVYGLGFGSGKDGTVH